MDWTSLLLGLFLGIVLGAPLTLGILYFLRTQESNTETISAESELLSAREEREALREELNASQQSLAAAHARLDEIHKRRESDDDLQREKETLVEMLHPVRQGVTEVQRRIYELEKERLAQQAKLSQQLTTAAQHDITIIESTQALLGSLHSTTSRGYWGEVQLKRIVESAGMLPHVDFSEQTTFTNENDETLRPDLIVHLPGKRQLIIDAKAPLNPLSPEDHAKALRQHVNSLASKRYFDAVEGSPDVVFCFIPAESLLSSALEADPSLLDYALNRGVTLVSPASLLAGLKAVETAWRHERLAKNMKEIVDHSRDLYRRLEKMSDHLNRTGDRLRQAVQAYNSLLGNIERQVLPKVETMSRLHVLESDGEGPGTEEQLHHAQELKTITEDVSELGPRLSRGLENHESEQSPS